MADENERLKGILRNLLLGKWAADKLKLSTSDAEIYAHALAKLGREAEGEVFSKIRKDFDAAGVNQTDGQILAEMTKLTIKAGDHFSGSKLDPTSRATMKIVRTLKGAGRSD